MLEAMQAGPSKWTKLTLGIGGLLCALTFALAIMLQWALWLAITSTLLHGWGMIVGVVICAAQILLFFESRCKKTACEPPQA